MSNIHTCHFCDRVFHFRDLYDKHEPVCEFFYKSNREKIREDEKLEQLPPIHDMYKLIQHMYVEMNRQRMKIEKLELILKRRTKNMDLFSNVQDPVIGFRSWVKQLTVKTEHLIHVFHTDIFEGIQKCLEDCLRENIATIPIRCFAEKPSILWIFMDTKESKKWVLCDAGDILYLVEQLMGEFMSLFCEWEDENQEWISRSMENKELHIKYLCKISGSLILNKERKRNELRNWLCRKIKQ